MTKFDMVITGELEIIDALSWPGLTLATEMFPSPCPIATSVHNVLFHCLLGALW
jgi:hypothetical protein